MDEGGSDLGTLKSDGGGELRKMGTHDNTATKVLRRVEDASGNVGTQPFCPPGEHGEEGTEEGGREDDEDGGNAEACEPGVAAARAAVDVVVVASEDVCTVHLGDRRGGKWVACSEGEEGVRDDFIRPAEKEKGVPGAGGGPREGDG